MMRTGGVARWSHMVEGWLLNDAAEGRVTKVLISPFDLVIGDELDLCCDGSWVRTRVMAAANFRLRMYDDGLGWVVTLGGEELSSGERRNLSEALGFDSIMRMRQYVERLGLRDALLLSFEVTGVELYKESYEDAAAGEG